MKEPYVKPKKVTEKLEIGMVMAGSQLNIAYNDPFFGLCPPCPP
jgi:hypothetical protein